MKKMEKIFDLFFGLPLHPLIDHVVVIFLPVFSIAQIAAFFFEKIRIKYGSLIQVGLGIGFVSSFIAKQSGEALSIRVGTPFPHAELGENLVLIALGLFVTSLVWFYLQKSENKVVSKIIGSISVLLAIATLVFTVLVGHSGAEATWKEKINPPAQSQSKPVNEQNTDTNSIIILSIEEVAKHNTENDCWTIVNNEVYNLTSYVMLHPGGVANIKNLCGLDGTSAFTSQHGMERRPNNELSEFKIGQLNQELTSVPDVAAQINKQKSYDEENEDENEGKEK
ncbi:MAG: cytochrome b5 domain-containing protein [Candidatus Nanopelagicales bacterium]